MAYHNSTDSFTCNQLTALKSLTSCSTIVLINICIRSTGRVITPPAVRYKGVLQYEDKRIYTFCHITLLPVLPYWVETVGNDLLPTVQ